jgi:UDP-GlcNAc:undecaprenyl-phosphate/decaprenyl-phosphate GlcNAc-1-phosphate transferase
MKVRQSSYSVNNGAILLIIFTALLTGLHGLFSLISLMIISRIDIGRDPKEKHGVSSGTSRLGGLAIIFSLLSGIFLNLYISDNLNYKNLISELNIVLFFSILVGLVGLVEDFKQSLSSSLRLFLVTSIILICFKIMPSLLPDKLNFLANIDESAREVSLYLFTTIMVVGFINAGNIADGANGLLSLSYLAFFYCMYSIDPSISNLSLIISLVIFIIYNTGTGRIFLGDFGAYFLSALVAYTSLEVYQKYEISVFFFASILVYPCFEITRSVVFRILNKVSVMSPDNNHLHNKLNNYFLNSGLNPHQSNSMTGIFLAFISSSLPTYLCINGVNPSNDLWFGLFIFEFLVLSSIYLFLSKINLKKI